MDFPHLGLVYHRKRRTCLAHLINMNSLHYNREHVTDYGTPEKYEIGETTGSTPDWIARSN